jgi:hypothetical protein
MGFQDEKSRQIYFFVQKYISSFKAYRIARVIATKFTQRKRQSKNGSALKLLLVGM